tara:strand:- start:2246 stop:3049 length:804 start_codon:yes stop_codon:yes gene_type:complete
MNNFDYIDRSQTGVLFFFERIARSHPIFYIIARYFASKLNIFESEYNGLSKLKFTKKVNLLDIGASNGISIKFFKSKLNLGKIFAVEPNEYYCEALKKIGNIKIYNFGLGDKDEKKKVFIPEYKFFNKKIDLVPYTFYDKKLLKKILSKNFFLYSNFRINEKYLSLKKNIEIKSRIDLIKIDVNGYEFQIIKTLSQLIKKHKPLIMVEELNKINKIDSYLSKLNYECYFYNTYSKKFIKYKKKIFNYKPLTFYFISKNNNYINFLKD